MTDEHKPVWQVQLSQPWKNLKQQMQGERQDSLDYDKIYDIQCEIAKETQKKARYLEFEKDVETMMKDQDMSKTELRLFQEKCRKNYVILKKFYKQVAIIESLKRKKTQILQGRKSNGFSGQLCMQESITEVSPEDPVIAQLNREIKDAYDEMEVHNKKAREEFYEVKTMSKDMSQPQAIKNMYLNSFKPTGQKQNQIVRAVKKLQNM